MSKSVAPLVKVEKFSDWDDTSRLVKNVNDRLSELQNPNIKILSVQFIAVDTCYVTYEIWPNMEVGS